MKTLFVSLLATLALHAEDAVAPTAAVEKKIEPTALVTEAVAQVEAPDIRKISEAFGHILGKNLETISVKFDVAQIVKGLQDCFAGKDSPMTEIECIQAITAAQEVVFKQQCQENLKRAETFLAENVKTTGVMALEEGKVQYKITAEGKGDVVDNHASPLIKYAGKYLDGAVFGASKEEEAISLDEIIPGLRAGLIGMKEGEKRTVYIHPDLAYGTSGLLPPNSLLTFEVEVIKANAPIVNETVDVQTTPQVAPAEIAENKLEVR